MRDTQWFDDEGDRQDTPPTAVNIARTHEEVLQNLARNGEQNFAEREAHRLGVDFDADTKDEFNRVNNNLE